jgi:ubiquitin-protein ligase
MTSHGSALRRIARDVADVQRNPMGVHGIHYEHDYDKAYEGWAAIFGHEDTPYAFGCYMFHIRYPTNYPVSPPEITFRTQDPRERTRFHPNLYRSGKVCRASLNTWKGEGWSSCLTLRAVLLDIAQAFNRAHPVLEEPGITLAHRDAASYHRALRYKNMEVAILGQLRLAATAEGALATIYATHRAYCFEHAAEIVARARALSVSEPMEPMRVGLYEMCLSGDYGPVLAALQEELGKEIDGEASCDSAGSKHGVLQGV